ncbi:hypothetical protein GCG21_08920 [Pseudactinotalea sp. HY160]|nr:hypothetical protein [Pseudactinotalea sp. HY160]
MSQSPEQACRRVDGRRVDGLRVDGLRVDGLRVDGRRVAAMSSDRSTVPIRLARIALAHVASAHNGHRAGPVCAFGIAFRWPRFSWSVLDPRTWAVRPSPEARRSSQVRFDSSDRRNAPDHPSMSSAQSRRAVTHLGQVEGRWSLMRARSSSSSAVMARRGRSLDRVRRIPAATTFTEGWSVGEGWPASPCRDAMAASRRVRVAGA